MKRVVLASHNKGKIEEFRAMLTDVDLDVKPLSDYNVPPAEEPAATFVENALIKARHAAEHTGLPALADDSGLVVPALSGAPGVLSARYGGKHGDSAAANAKLQEALTGVPLSERQGYFFCCLAYLDSVDDPTPIISEGRWYGTIALEADGDQGFGYDPLFFDPEHGCTAARMSRQLKYTVSHRARALTQWLSLYRERHLATLRNTG